MRKHLPLAAVLGVAAVVRYWAIDFCLPALVCRPDEEAVASIATGFFARDLNPHFFDWPPVFMYAVALAMVPYFKYAKYTGWMRSEFKFLQWISLDPTPLFLAARIISAAAGTASVWIIYRIGLRLFDRTTALVAALFLALAYLHVRDSHFGVTDVTATFFVLIVMLCSARMAGTMTMRDLVFAGIMTGIAGATKYNAALVALPVAWIVATDPAARSIKKTMIRLLMVTGITAGAFLVAAPFSVIDSAAFLRSLTNISTHLATGHGPSVGRGWWVHATSSLRYGVGMPVLIAGVLGMLWMIRQSPRVGIMIALFPVATYAALGNSLTVFARYAEPIVPFLCLGAAYGVTELARAVAARSRRPQLELGLAWIAALILIAPSARSVWMFDRLLAIDDSRIVAARWITEHFPNGATIGENERRWNRLSFRAIDAEHPSPYQTMVLTPEMIDSDVIVVAESPLHPGGVPDEVPPERLARYTRGMETSGPERSGSRYDWQDEFYIPLAGIDHLDRPGPRITLLTRR